MAVRLFSVAGYYCQLCDHKIMCLDSRLCLVVKCKDYMMHVFDGHLKLSIISPRIRTFEPTSIGKFKIESLRLVEDSAHFFRIYSNPLDMCALRSLASAGSQHCIEAKEKLFACYLVTEGELIKCLCPMFVNVLLRVLLMDMQQLSVPDKLSKALEVIY